jgi:hypothetical protein
MTPSGSPRLVGSTVEPAATALEGPEDQDGVVAAPSSSAPDSRGWLQECLAAMRSLEKANHNAYGLLRFGRSGEAEALLAETVTGLRAVERALSAIVLALEEPRS